MLIVVGAVLAVCCVGAVGLGVWGFNAVKDAVGPAQDRANTYLTDVNAGNYAAAYAQLCAGNRAHWTQAEYEKLQSSLPKVSSHKITGVNVVNRNGKQSATVGVRLTTESGAQIDQVMYLVKEDGDWKVCQPGI